MSATASYAYLIIPCERIRLKIRSNGRFTKSKQRTVIHLLEELVVGAIGNNSSDGILAYIAYLCISDSFDDNRGLFLCDDLQQPSERRFKLPCCGLCSSILRYQLYICHGSPEYSDALESGRSSGRIYFPSRPIHPLARHESGLFCHLSGNVFQKAQTWNMQAVQDVHGFDV